MTPQRPHTSEHKYILTEIWRSWVGSIDGWFSKKKARMFATLMHTFTMLNMRGRTAEEWINVTFLALYAQMKLLFRRGGKCWTLFHHFRRTKLMPILPEYYLCKFNLKKERISTKAIRAKASARSEPTMKMSRWDSTKTASLPATKLQEELKGGTKNGLERRYKGKQIMANFLISRLCRYRLFEH